jgi:hypothetical protein
MKNSGKNEISTHKVPKNPKQSQWIFRAHSGHIQGTLRNNSGVVGTVRAYLGNPVGEDKKAQTIIITVLVIIIIIIVMTKPKNPNKPKRNPHRSV